MEMISGVFQIARPPSDWKEMDTMSYRLAEDVRDLE
jgi:hypothetical protein